MQTDKAPDMTADIRAELQTLKDDLMTVKEDMGKVTSSAMRQGRAAADAFKDQAAEGLNSGVETARQCVQEHPISSALIALGVGLSIGMLLTTRR